MSNGNGNELNLDGDLAPVFNVDFAAVRAKRAKVREIRAEQTAAAIVMIADNAQEKKKQLITELRGLRERERRVASLLKNLDTQLTALNDSISDGTVGVEHIAKAVLASVSGQSHLVRSVIIHPSRMIESEEDRNNFLEMITTVCNGL